jgi:transcriptional regulator with XRE-family HTH domain
MYYTAMTKTVKNISTNLKRLRELKNLSQKEVSAKSGIPQGQYSRMENGLVEPSISTLEKVAKALDVGITEFFKSGAVDIDINLPLLEKIRLIDTLDKDERKAIETVIDIAISRKHLKESIAGLIGK